MKRLILAFSMAVFVTFGLCGSADAGVMTYTFYATTNVESPPQRLGSFDYDTPPPRVVHSDGPLPAPPAHVSIIALHVWRMFNISFSIPTDSAGNLIAVAPLSAADYTSVDPSSDPEVLEPGYQPFDGTIYFDRYQDVFIRFGPGFDQTWQGPRSMERAALPQEEQPEPFKFDQEQSYGYWQVTNAVAAPEPATLTLAAFSLAGFAGYALRKRKKIVA